MSTQPKLPPGRAAEADGPMARDGKASSAPSKVTGIAPDILKGLQVSLETHLGGAELSIQDLLGLKRGSVVKLDVRLNEPVELRLHGAVVARGEIVAVGDNFGIRILEVGELK